MKTKIITLLTATVLSLSICSISLGTKQVSAASSLEGIVTTNTLNVREQAAATSKKVGSLKKDKVVTITTQQSSWSKIKSGSTTGWVSNKYIDKLGYVTDSSLNLRESNSTSSTKLATLTKNTKVQIKATKGNWLQVYVSSKKKTGWVSSKYISTKKTTVVTAATTTTYYVTASSLNIRQSASSSSEKVATIYKGDAVTYYSKSGNWAKVKTANDITGWASMTYLSQTKPIITKTYYVTADPYDPLNVRSSASTKAKILTTVSYGEAVTYYSNSGNWSKIKTADDITGWVDKSYLSTTKPTDESEGTAETVSNPITTVFEDKIIVLDPGHGGKDPGALGKDNREKDLALSTAKKLAAKLEDLGATVLMTRTGDTYPTLSERVQFSKDHKADVFISIHYNAGSSTANGIETFYWTSHENEKELSTYVQEEVIESTGLKSRGVKTGSFQVIRTNDTQAILVELGFISNPDEEKIIETNTFQTKAATGIVNGLKAYFESL